MVSQQEANALAEVVEKLLEKVMDVMNIPKDRSINGKIIAQVENDPNKSGVRYYIKEEEV